MSKNQHLVRIKIAAVFLFCCFCACTDSPRSNQHVNKSATRTIQPFSKESINFYPFRISVINKSLLVSPIGGIEGFIFSVFDKQSLKQGESIVKMGEGPDEIQSCYSISKINAHEFSVYDNRKNKFNIYKLEDLLTNPNAAPSSSIILEERNLHQPMTIDKNRIISTTLSAKKLNRFLVHDMGGEFLFGSQDYPEVNPKIDTIGIPEALRCTFCGNPEERYIVSSYLNYNRIDFYKFDRELKIDLLNTVSFEDPFEAVFESEISNGAHTLFSITDKTREAFFSIRCNADRVFMLFSGRLLEETGRERSIMDNHCNRLLEFRSDGEFLNEFILNQPILTQFDIEDRVLYGFSEANDMEIISYKIPL
ncbi:MAG: hypothetical protein ACJA01_001026 [Saprospiraceae bacterium]|jgi:hypothetical protein